MVAYSPTTLNLIRIFPTWEPEFAVHTAQISQFQTQLVCKERDANLLNMGMLTLKFVVLRRIAFCIGPIIYLIDSLSSFALSLVLLLIVVFPLASDATREKVLHW